METVECSLCRLIATVLSDVLFTDMHRPIFKSKLNKQWGWGNQGNQNFFESLFFFQASTLAFLSAQAGLIFQNSLFAALSITLRIPPSAYSIFRFEQRLKNSFSYICINQLSSITIWILFNGISISGSFRSMDLANSSMTQNIILQQISSGNGCVSCDMWGSERDSQSISPPRTRPELMAFFSSSTSSLRPLDQRGTEEWTIVFLQVRLRFAGHVHALYPIATGPFLQIHSSQSN